jgi:gliding motility-associated-like protein
MRSLLLSVLFLLSLVFSAGDAFATHARAGEITATRISSSSLTYEIKLTAYFDIETGAVAAEYQTSVNFFIGNSGPITAERKLPITNIGNNTTRNEYPTTYTFSAPGRYTISVWIEKRNANILNIGPAPTTNLGFYVHTTIIINAGLGLNRTPVLLNAPIDIAAVGQRYIHNPGAFDADGDSLAYRMFVPQSGVEGSGAGIDVEYKDPNLVTPVGPKEDGSLPSYFGIDHITGDLVWDAPSIQGYYNVAFIVEEWRGGVKIGEVIRDMQIIVKEADNDRPAIDSIPDLCVIAGALIRQPVTAKDKNGDRLMLSSTSGIYRSDLVPLQNGAFTISNQNAQSEVNGLVTWQTGCAHVRDEPYEVLIKVEDNARPGYPNPSLFRKLVDIRTFRISVIGPQPQNLRAEAVTTAEGKAFNLTWSAYQCQIPGGQIVIYRKEACTDFEPGCFAGLPASLGYTEVGRVAITATTFSDNNQGEGFRGGIRYSYRIVVEFPRQGAGATDPGRLVGGGKSLASEQVCLDFPLLMPVITNVTVDTTSTTRGVVTVKWTRPVGLNPSSIEGPSQYKLYRATGQTGTDYTLIYTRNSNLQQGVADTIYTDVNLNTELNAYRYRIEYSSIVNGALVSQGFAEPASSVRLERGSGGTSRQVSLNWTANVPWQNSPNRKHKVFREDKAKPGTFNQIAEVTVQSTANFTYTDDGTDRFPSDGVKDLVLYSDSTYCYRVETEGTYDNERIKPDLLYNMSQIICANPLDTIRPCPPVLTLEPLDCAKLDPSKFCNQSGLSNELSWTYPNNATCDQNVVKYNIYYAARSGDNLVLIGSSLSTNYTHTGLSSYAGCYYVTAVNKYGNESNPSNTECKENCGQFVLPNVFTPNGDGKNDTFKPMECPAFVESVEFRVFDRWGVKVFETNDVDINWDGKSTSGKALPASQYFYEAVVRFQSVNVNSEPMRLKGWIQLLR